MKKKIVINTLLVIFICIFLYSGYNVILWIKSDIEIKKLEQGLYTDVVSRVEKENTETNNPTNVTVNFEKLNEVNKDIIAWINIDGTYINYPILQGTTDEYYLRKDIYKNYSISGSIFVDSTASKEFLDDNTVIYGHNMKNQRMFADLHKIYNGELGTNIDIQIYLPEKINNYKVFSTYISESNNEDIIKKKFDENNEKYINDLIQKSKIKFDVDNVDFNEKIITLVTCDTNRKKRVVVHAIKQK